MKFGDIYGQATRSGDLTGCYTFANIAALSTAVATINPQNALHFAVGGRFGTKAAGAAAVSKLGDGVFATQADLTTCYYTLGVSQGGVWYAVKGADGGGIPDLFEKKTGRITALSTANPAVATHTSHGLDSGDEIMLLGGGLKISNQVFEIEKIDANSYKMIGLNGADIGGTFAAVDMVVMRFARAPVAVVKVVLSGGTFLLGTTLFNAAGVTATAYHVSAPDVGAKY